MSESILPLPSNEHSTTGSNVQLAKRWQQLFSLARHWGYGGADIDDLIQETLLKVIVARRREPGVDTTMNWIRCIMRNTAIDRFRKRQRERKLTERLGRQPQSIPPSVGGASRIEELGDEVRTALAQLPPALRLAVECVDVQGLSYEEAAKRCQCPSGTLMSRLHRARQRLRPVLEEYAVGFGYRHDTA